MFYIVWDIHAYVWTKCCVSNVFSRSLRKLHISTPLKDDETNAWGGGHGVISYPGYLSYLKGKVTKEPNRGARMTGWWSLPWTEGTNRTKGWEELHSWNFLSLWLWVLVFFGDVPKLRNPTKNLSSLHHAWSLPKMPSFTGGWKVLMTRRLAKQLPRCESKRLAWRKDTCLMAWILYMCCNSWIIMYVYIYIFYMYVSIFIIYICTYWREDVCLLCCATVSIQWSRVLEIEEARKATPLRHNNFPLQEHPAVDIYIYTYIQYI